MLGEKEGCQWSWVSFGTNFVHTRFYKGISEYIRGNHGFITVEAIKVYVLHPFLYGKKIKTGYLFISFSSIFNRMNAAGLSDPHNKLGETTTPIPKRIDPGALP